MLIFVVICDMWLVYLFFFGEKLNLLIVFWHTRIAKQSVKCGTPTGVSVFAIKPNLFPNKKY